MRLADISPELNVLTERVIGAMIEVHRTLGPGHKESVYRDATCVELGIQKIEFEREALFPLAYKGVSVGSGRLDILIERRLVLELKAVDVLIPAYKAQVIAYLKLTRCEVGLLINFNVPMLKDGIIRLINPDLRLPRHS